MAKSEIKEDVWEVLWQDQDHGTEVRVVSWNDREPVLEKRYVMIDKETGERRTGRCKGFDLTDIKYLLDNGKKIIDLFSRGEPVGKKQK